MDVGGDIYWVSIRVRAERVGSSGIRYPSRLRVVSIRVRAERVGSFNIPPNVCGGSLNPRSRGTCRIIVGDPYGMSILGLNPRSRGTCRIIAFRRHNQCGLGLNPRSRGTCRIIYGGHASASGYVSIRVRAERVGSSSLSRRQQKTESQSAFARNVSDHPAMYAAHRPHGGLNPRSRGTCRIILHWMAPKGWG